MLGSSENNSSASATGTQAPKEDKSYFAPPPAISLPKGGGAIKGMGEKFAANPVTGTGSMSVPIATTPGRSGFAPQLSLSYDSGSGNGIFGMGWNLALPAITRRTDKGLPHYWDGEESDVFILSGAEDLVPLLNPDGSRFQDTAIAPGFIIYRYRPRIEGLFARIERWTKLDSGEIHWRSISNDNITTLYGQTQESRIADPDNQTHAFSWLICESYDDKGNAIQYKYKSEDSEGISLAQAHEHNRTPEGRSSNRYLKRIYYGNRVSHLVQPEFSDRDWLFEVVFDYGEHDLVNPQPIESGKWQVRNDPLSSYRSGFEVRTYRLCQRVLMFHHIPDLLDAAKGYDGLVRSTDLTYTYEQNPIGARNPIYSFLKLATQTGYKRNFGGDGYLTKSLPPLEFTYSEPIIDERVWEVDPESLENLPQGLDGTRYQWVDLDGEGLSGILTEQGGGWFYKRNLSPINPTKAADVRRVEAKFAAVGVVETRPASGLANGSQFMDLAGDGQPDVVMLRGGTPGFYERTQDEGWESFVAFKSLPNLDWDNPQLRFIDLDGDGHADILITEDNCFVWHLSLSEDGFEAAQRVHQPWDEEKGPRVVFADSTQSIYLADMSGDGLTDIVRIRNSDICYWANLGYGRFGTKVTMDNAPCFDALEIFNQSRIILADIDGSGTTDILYLCGEGVQVYFNQSGNGWSAKQLLKGFPQIDNVSSVTTIDLLGNGTACLVWSSPLSGYARREMRYIDLMGGQKPHLLIKTVNNLGAETTVQYAPSTKFYLEDRQAGKPWITKLPFPVHVVEQVETYDRISGNRFVSRHAYHHGYFDGIEREFRGFGMVEQWDTEAFEDYVVGVKRVEGGQELAPELYQPPVMTRTWYHTGAFLDRDRILHQFRDEYYQKAEHIPEPVLPSGLADDREFRECLRALKGLPLRQEIYSFDGSAQEQHPYSVVENNFDIRKIQARKEQRHAVFFPIGRESVSLNYERNPADPRISHSFNLDVDEYGNTRKSCSVVYGRKAADPLLPLEVNRDRQQLYITYAETDFTLDIDQLIPTAAYRLRVPYESRSYEITGIAPDANLFQFERLKSSIAGTIGIDYEVVANGVTPQKRLLAQGRTLFLDNNLNPLPLSQWDSLGLGHQSYQLAFTPAITNTHYAGKVTDADFTAAGYQHFNGDANWWIPSGTAIYPANPADRFYIPIGAKDPMGLETIATLDRYNLLVERVQVRQAAWTETIAINDYRVLAPVMAIDPNKNRAAVEFDVLGMVVKSAVMGKEGAGEGDTLEDPTVRMEYELFNWMNHRQPNFVHTFAREQHGAANPRWQESYAYSNGSGGVAMVKAQAHPGKALQVNPDGTSTEVDANPRWVGNGRTILNNKGNPVKQYEPYFSTTHEYEDEKVLREIGVTSIAYYDAIGRNIRTLFPNGTLSRVEFDPWMQKVFDANDTVKESQWYADRGSPDPATQAEPVNNPERRAAWLAAKHANTPGIVYFDSLGRSVYAISDYGGGKIAAVRSESDLTGRFSKLFDQERREVASGFVGMAGIPILGESAEKGRRWTFLNVLGAMVKTWDEHGREFRAEYDNLHRPVSTFVREAGLAEILFTYVVYGDRLPNAVQLNLLGIAHQVFDQAGMVRVPELDFKGNPKQIERVLAKDYKNNLNWNTLPSQPNYAAIQATANPVLEIGEVFIASSLQDALNRPTRVTLPDGTEIVPTYNEANFLASLQAQIRGQGAFIEFLKDQDYDAKGQRQFAHYGNEVFTRYFYDPNTFRLTNLLTYKSGDDPDTNGLQNLHYTYDPNGNITQIRDAAQRKHYFSNAVVQPENLFEYDAIYQLIRATGREHASLTNNVIRNHNDLEFVPQLPHANNAEAVRTYTEEYEYDLLGNIKMLRHRFQAQAGAGSGWTRHYRYAYEDDSTNRNNRLSATSAPGDPDAGPFSATYSYDAYGNMTKMPHLTDMVWNFMDQLRQVDLGGGGTAYYVYGTGGQRIRKVIERNDNTNLEWIFIGAVMIFRRRNRNNNALRLERWTIHIGDDTGNIAQVDTKTRDEENSDPANPANVPLIRYQYANHLGSAVMETDKDGNVISYEEYHPYGTSAYRSAKPGFDLSLKQYRFSGKECDNETGLYYFGARYYAAWLGRWTSSDPAGLADGFNLHWYCRNNPIMLSDPNGMDSGTVSTKLPEDVESAQKTNTDDARNTVATYLTDKTFTGPNGESVQYVPDSIHWDKDRKKNWAKFQTIESAVGEGESNKSSPGSTLAGAGGAIVRNNPAGNTIIVPEGIDDAKLARLEEGVRQRTVGKNAGRGNSTSGRRNSPAQRAALAEFKARNPKLTSTSAAGHRIDMQYDLTGRVGENWRDYAWEDGATNARDGREGFRTLSTEPQGVPAGGVSRPSTANSFRNSPRYRSGMRAAGTGLTLLGTGLSAYSLYRDIREGDVPMGIGDGLGVIGGGVELYAVGAAARSGTLIGGVMIGRVAAMPLGIAISGAAIAITSGVSGYRAYQRGDTAGVVAGAVGVAAGTSLAVGGTIALVSAAGIAMAPALIAAAPVLIAAGAIAAIGVGIFHIGRYFDWW
jgi:RHS repeat-associated protein